MTALARIAPRLPARLLLFPPLLLVSFLSGRSAEAQDPWKALERLRVDMQKAGPLTARFEQAYYPAGFSTPDTENGHLSVWLPDCLRWNYEEPEVKNFLLCGGEVHFWTPQDDRGRQYSVDPETEPGLDLLLVPIDRLRERYNARGKRIDERTIEIQLSLPGDEEGFAARLRIDETDLRVQVLEYLDREGNRTRFTLRGYQRLTHTALFNPPKDMEWVVE